MGLEDYLDDTIYRTGDRNQYVFRGDDVLGSGAFGIVFHGVDVLAGREVAVKVEAAKMESPLLPCESEAYDLIGPRRKCISPRSKTNTLHWLAVDALLQIAGRVLGLPSHSIYNFLFTPLRWHSDQILLRHNGKY